MLLSTFERLAEPLIVAYGPSRTVEGLRVDMLFVAARVKLTNVTLTGGGERITVSLPETYLNLPEPQWFADATLKEQP